MLNRFLLLSISMAFVSACKPTISIGQRDFSIICSTGGGWDHCSVGARFGEHLAGWNELEFVRKIVFKENETVMQLHVPAEEHINNHAGVLHLWRPQAQEIPKPPMIYV